MGGPWPIFHCSVAGVCQSDRRRTRFVHQVRHRLPLPAKPPRRIAAFGVPAMRRSFVLLSCPLLASILLVPGFQAAQLRAQTNPADAPYRNAATPLEKIGRAHVLTP